MSRVSRKNPDFRDLRDRNIARIAKRMVHIEALDLAPGTPVTFAHGGMHVMLMALAVKLEEGSTFPRSLTFENA